VQTRERGPPSELAEIFPLVVVLLLTTIVKIPEGVVVGFLIFAWAPNY
jgi:hypothetical protein